MLNLVRFAEGFLRALVVTSHESFLSRFQFLLRNGIELRLCLLRAACPANECRGDQSTGSHKPKHAVSGGSPKGCVHIGWNYATRLIEFMNYDVSVAAEVPCAAGPSIASLAGV